METDPREGHVDKLQKGIRPIPLTIFCALGFMSFPLFLSQYRSAYLRDMEYAINGREHFHWFFVIYLGLLVGYAGLWLMRRWGFHLFLIVVAAMAVHMAIGTQNKQAFRSQVVAEEAGQAPAPGAKVFDTSFLDRPEFEARQIGNEEGVISVRDAILASSPRQAWTIFLLRILPPLFVCFVAFLVRDRFR